MARACTHARKGIVTNQDPSQPYDRKRSHASRSVCDRGPCIEQAISWVAGITNETATHYPDPQKVTNA